MADLRAARAAIQRAYTKLIGRFGPESDVIEALQEAMGHLKEPPPAEPEPLAEDFAEEPPAETEQPVYQPPPRRRRR